MKSDVVSKLESIVGKDFVVSDILDCVAYGGEVVPFDIEDQNIPIAVVKPKTSQEISEILKYANEVMVPIAVHGSGTSFLFSSRPKRKDSIVLSTSRLDSVEFHEDNGYVEVGAGVITYDLEQSLSARGYMFPINTGSKFYQGSVPMNISGNLTLNTAGNFHEGPADINIMGDYVLLDGEFFPDNSGKMVFKKGSAQYLYPNGNDLGKVEVTIENTIVILDDSVKFSFLTINNGTEFRYANPGDTITIDKSGGITVNSGGLLRLTGSIINLSKFKSG